MSKSRTPRWRIHWKKGAGRALAPKPEDTAAFEQRRAELEALVERARRGESPVSAAQAMRDLFP